MDCKNIWIVKLMNELGLRLNEKGKKLSVKSYLKSFQEPQS